MFTLRTGNAARPQFAGFVYRGAAPGLAQPVSAAGAAVACRLFRQDRGSSQGVLTPPPGEESKTKAKSAMARARQLSQGLQTAAIMKHVRNAIKGSEYRQYKTQAEDRLAEFTRMVDLDSEDPALR